MKNAVMRCDNMGWVFPRKSLVFWTFDSQDLLRIIIILINFNANKFDLFKIRRNQLYDIKPLIKSVWVAILWVYGVGRDETSLENIVSMSYDYKSFFVLVILWIVFTTLDSTWTLILDRGSYVWF
jgi:hypothetical protein